MVKKVGLNFNSGCRADYFDAHRKVLNQDLQLLLDFTALITLKKSQIWDADLDWLNK